MAINDSEREIALLEYLSRDINERLFLGATEKDVIELRAQYNPEIAGREIWIQIDSQKLLDATVEKLSKQLLKNSIGYESIKAYVGENGSSYKLKLRTETGPEKYEKEKS